MSETAFPFRVTSGFRPLKGLHLGHYVAVLKDLVRLQYAHRSSTFVFVADHHARSKWDERADFVNVGKKSVEVAKQLLAIGIDPQYTTLYRQSDVPEIFEIMWFLAGVGTDAQLRRNHAFKGHAAPTTGIYLYPLLMVADIVSVRATHVAIGQDQKQHLELARDVARKLIRRFGADLLPVPESLRPTPVLLYGTDSNDVDHRKMASEFENEIALFDDEDVVSDRIDGAATRPVSWGHPLPTEGCMLLEFVEAAGGLDARKALEVKYAGGQFGYIDAKQELREIFFDTMSKPRQEYARWSDDDVKAVLIEGAKRAREHIAHFVFDLRRELASSY